MTMIRSQNARALLAGALVLAALSAALWLLLETPAPEEAAHDEAIVLADRAAADIASVSVRSAVDDYALAQESGQWVVAGYPDVPVEPGNIANLLSRLAQVSASRAVEKNPADLAAYGLTVPVGTVTVNYEDGTAAAYTLGAQAPGELGYYCQVKGDKAVYLVPRAHFDPALVPGSSYFSKEMAPALEAGEIPDRIAFEDLTSGLTVTAAALPEEERDGKGARFRYRITAPIERYASKAVGNIYSGKLFGLRAAEVLFGNPGAETISACGFDDPLYAVAFERGNVRYRYLVGLEESEGYVVMREGDRSRIFLVSKEEMPYVGQGIHSFISDTPFLPPIGQIASFTVEGGGKVVTFTALFDPETDAQRFTAAGGTFTLEAVRNLYRLLGSAHSITPYAGEPAGEALLAVTFRCADPLLPAVTHRYCAVGDRQATVTVDGETDFLVNIAFVNKVLADLDLVLAGKPTSQQW